MIGIWDQAPSASAEGKLSDIRVNACIAWSRIVPSLAGCRSSADWYGPFEGTLLRSDAARLPDSPALTDLDGSELEHQQKRNNELDDEHVC